MSKKIYVDPVLRFLENNHDLCDTKKEIKVLCIERSAIITGLIRANHLLCFRYYEKSFWPLYQRHKKENNLLSLFIDLKKHFPEL